jgi:hypothetical protein
MNGIDREAFAIFGDRRVPLRARLQRAEAAQRTAERMAANMIEGPHVLGVEPQMRLRDESLAIGADETEILDRVGEVPRDSSLPIRGDR